MATGKSVKALSVRAPDGTEIIPGMRPGDVEGAGFTPPMLLAFNVHTSSSAPTPNDDAGDGHFVNRLWRHLNAGTSTDDLYVCLSASSGAAVWRELQSPGSIVGLTNPLVAGLNAAGHLIFAAPFAGFRDRYYDLAADASNYVSGGVATLTGVYNAYQHANLTDALQIVLPDPDSVGANDALFGIVSIKLGSGGSITISQSESWAWEKASASEADPTIPTAEGAIVRLRYSYDPVAGQYAVSLSHLPAGSAPSSGAIEMIDGAWSQSSLSANNRDEHSHTHTWTSDTQDGTVYAVVIFVSDGEQNEVTAPGELTEATRTPTGNYSDAHTYIGFYKPSQGDLDANTKTFTFTKNNEIGQIIVFEVTGPSSGIAVGNTAFSRNSSPRSSVPSEDLNVLADGSFLLCVCGRDTKTSGDTKSVLVSSANGFTTLVARTSTAVSDPAYAVTYRENVTEGTYGTPVFNTSDGSALDRVQMEAVVLEPA